MSVDSRSAAIDAIRLVSLSSVEDVDREMAFAAELVQEPVRAALVLVALAAMVNIGVTRSAVLGGEPREQVLARMLDAACRWPLGYEPDELDGAQ